MSSTTILRFSNNNKQFYNELRKRVDGYFKEHNLSKNGNFNLYLKTVFMYCAYYVPYILLVSNVFDSKLVWLLLAAIMGFAMAGIGLCVMHDANHGSFSKNTTLNKIIGYLSLNMLGGHAINWKIQHNVIHHTFTNVHGHDEDIAPPGFLRFEPHSERKWVHKLQFLYAWFFYGLMTIMWSTTKDFKQLLRYEKKGLLKSAGTNLRTEMAVVIISKVVYYGYMLLPYFLVKEMSLLEWFTGFVVLHYIAGLVLAMIFQPAHVVAETEFPVPAEGGTFENTWAEHQLRTTMNFATKDPVFSWLVGGLNYQVEHHLFPTISHVHYPKISAIVAQTAKEFNLPYKQQRTFVGALWSHQQMLWRFGRH